MELSSNTMDELGQLTYGTDRALAKVAARVWAAGTREVLAANTELHSALLVACKDEDYQRDVRADLNCTIETAGEAALVYDGHSEYVKCPECGECLGDQAEILGDVEADGTGPVAAKCSCGWAGRWRRK